MTRDQCPMGISRGDPDPYPNFAWLRRKAPVSEVLSRNGIGTTWLVASYDLAKSALADERLSNDVRAAHSNVDEGSRAHGLLGLDRPEHARLRGVLSGAFSSGAVERWAPLIESIVNDAIDKFAQRGSSELVQDFCLPVPVAIVHELLGIPEDVRQPARECFDLFARAGIDPLGDVEAEAELDDYVTTLIDYKRVHPADDLGTLLVAARSEGTLHSEEELKAMFLGLLGAGHVSTTQFLGCAFLQLVGSRDRIEQILGPEQAAYRAIDELLRVDPPFQVTSYRFAKEDMMLGSATISRGDAVIIGLASANHDETRYPDPDVVDFDRQRLSNLAFGRGAHMCLGIHVARLEALVALRTLFSRLVNVQLNIDPDEVVWKFGPLLRGPERLPVTFDTMRG